MKVGIVCFTGNSGLTDYSVSLGRALAQSKKHDVFLITADTIPGRFHEYGMNVTAIFRRSRHLLIDYPRFFWHCIANKYDALIFQGPIKLPFVDGLIVRLLKLARIKCIITVHDVLPHYPTSITRKTFPFYYRSAHQLIAHSSQALSDLRTYGVHLATTIVPHGVYDIFNMERHTKATARQALKLDNDAFVCLFFGNQEQRKGFIDVVDAARILSKNGKNRFQFVFAGQMEAAGSKEYQAALREAKEDLPNCIVHAGYAPFEEVEAYFKSADVVLLPYHEGTTSGVLKLAIAFGTPVIATKVGDFSEQVAYCDHHLLQNGNLGLNIANVLEIATDPATDVWCGPTQSASDLAWHTIASKLNMEVLK
jgi:glycosyltransferase involved in cell wall biosynthesis